MNGGVYQVLEVGSGWGSFAIRLAQTVPGTVIDTITLSSRQVELANERVKEAGLQDRIRVHLMDYRNMPQEWEGAFDRFVSVEMMEHVGHEFMQVRSHSWSWMNNGHNFVWPQVYWRHVHLALKADTGAGVIQCITLPEASKPRFPGTHVGLTLAYAI